MVNTVLFVTDGDRQTYNNSANGIINLKEIQKFIDEAGKLLQKKNPRQ